MIVHNFVAVGQTIPVIWPFFNIFKMVTVVGNGGGDHYKGCRLSRLRKQSK